MMGTDLQPITIRVPAVAYTGTSQELPLGSVAVNARILAARLIAQTDITGHTTNYSTLTIKRKGAAGTATTAVATLALTSGVDVKAFVPKAITLTTTKANLELSAGHALSWSWVEAGSGLDLPDAVIEVDLALGYGGGI